jgi:hypothetical protein
VTTTHLFRVFLFFLLFLLFFLIVFGLGLIIADVLLRLRVVVTQHAALGQLLHHLEELLAVVLEQVVCDGEDAA